MQSKPALLASFLLLLPLVLRGQPQVQAERDGIMSEWDGSMFWGGGLFHSHFVQEFLHPWQE